MKYPSKLAGLRGKKTKYICVYYTHELLKKIELGLEISLSGLLATLEPQTGCNWHANFFTAQTPFTVSIGCLFHCWAAVKPLQKQLGGVRQMCSTTCKMRLFPEDGKVTAFLERFQQRCPISVPAPVISTCPCVQKHRGKEEEKLLSLLPASLQHLQHSMASSGIGWSNFWMPSGPDRILPPVKILHQTISTLKYFSNSAKVSDLEGAFGQAFNDSIH